MWDTPEGDRKLKGAERALFLAGTLSLLDVLRNSIPEDVRNYGVPAFDSLTLEQRKWVLLLVAESVFGESPAPELAAWNAGAVIAVFAHLLENVEGEIDHEAEVEDPDFRVYWRTLVCAAWAEVTESSLEDVSQGKDSKQNSDDKSEWFSKLEVVREGILHDDDAQFEGLMDMHPERARKAKEFFGIEDAFYTSIPPAFTFGDYRRLASLHRSLLAEAAK